MHCLISLCTHTPCWALSSSTGCPATVASASARRRVSYWLLGYCYPLAPVAAVAATGLLDTAQGEVLRR